MRVKGFARLIPLLAALACLMVACGGSTSSTSEDSGNDTQLADTAQPAADLADGSINAGDLQSDGPDNSGPTAAPNLVLTDINTNSATSGIERQLKQLVGKGVVLYFVHYT